MSFEICQSERNTDVYWKDLRDLTHSRIGPGSYNIDKIPFQNKKKYCGYAPFSSMSLRFKGNYKYHKNYR